MVIVMPGTAHLSSSTYALLDTATKYIPTMYHSITLYTYTRYILHVRVR